MRAYQVEFGVPEDIHQQVEALLKQTHAPAVLMLAMLESHHYAEDEHVHVNILRALSEAFHVRNDAYDREFEQKLRAFADQIESELEAMES